jgi:FKBP-type peptidyl-prolyl cis-trans isomerase SlyD
VKLAFCRSATRTIEFFGKEIMRYIILILVFLFFDSALAESPNAKGKKSQDVVTQVSKNTVVSVAYVLSDAKGKLIENGRDPMLYLHGGYGSTFPRFEKLLQGKSVGYEAVVQLEPKDAYGKYKPALIRVEHRSRLTKELKIGMQLNGAPEGPASQNGDDPIIFTVKSIDGDKVVLDGNHPLVGMALTFSLRIVGIRPASDEEIRLKKVINRQEPRD